MGRKKRPKRDYNIPHQEGNVHDASNEPSRYSVGEPGVDFYSIKKRRPIFAFDYLSLSKSELCFNHKQRTKQDLLGFFEGLKKISSFTYEEMKHNPVLRFHSIDFNDHRVKLKAQKFFKILAPSGKGMTIEELPNLYQFDLQYQREARAVGFLFKGVFYVVWYDRDHVIYPGK